MKIESARYEDGALILETARSPEVMRLCVQFQAGEYEIKKSKKKRSLDSNAYAWVLIDKLAGALKLPKIEVYRKEIKDIGGVSETVCMPTEAVEKVTRAWEKNGIGWQTETMPSKLEGCTNVVLYFGSSSYSTEQMSIFLDHIIEDCRACGIETLPPEKLSGLKEQWK